VDNGESAFIEVVDAPGLEALGQGIARRCPLQGLFKMDFKRDPRDGRWFLLEINARASLWHYVGAANGVNLMRAAYEYLVQGLAPVPRRAGTRTRWLNLGLDAKASRQLRSRGELSWPGWIASLASPRMVYGLFAWHDPMPWVMHWRGRLFRRACAFSTRFRSSMRPWRSTAS
jgi:predicted ATP-grasp superfamily ATP-dependent carboligase